MASLLQEERDEFSKKWEKGEIDGWNFRQNVEAEIEEEKKKRAAEAEARRKAQSDHINDIDDDDDVPVEEEIPDFSTVESIEKLGADKLKEMLKNMGAKCG